MRGRLIEVLLVVLIWGLLMAFIIYDTPQIPQKIVESPSYWHYLDEICPVEDTAHYQSTPASAGDFYYGGTDK